MCGILCLLTTAGKTTPLQKLYNDCKILIDRRGPNHQKTMQFSYNNTNIEIYAGVLWLQGDNLIKQPIETSKSIFLYNGDIFGGTALSTHEQAHGDTELFLETLESSLTCENLCNIQGPYAFIYYDKINSNLHFGRDIFGRRSLLLAVDKQNDAFLLTSVAVRTDLPVIEVPSIGIFSFNLVTATYSLSCWPKSYKNFDEKLKSVKNIIQCDINVNNRNNKNITKFVMPHEQDLKVFENVKDLTIEAGFESLLKDSVWMTNVMQLKEKLEKAVKSRICTQPKYCSDCISTRSDCGHCRVGILFSGGVDCTILALIADKFINNDIPIDLMNVAFDKVADYNTPDRLTGLQSLAELRDLRPMRKWNFLEINVTREELDEARSAHIADLLFPLNTILDDSLGCALWFASRGKTETYVSPCRVVLVGMGADELFGGYTRHRAAFKNRGWHGLHDVLEEDWANIAHRNLARDDRIVADHGRQLRTPYLDEEVVDFVQSLSVWEKTYPANDLAQGFGEKILLRTLAYYLGLRCSASFKKRALQFGSRIADKKENAHEVSARLAL